LAPEAPLARTRSKRNRRAVIIVLQDPRALMDWIAVPNFLA